MIHIIPALAWWVLASVVGAGSILLSLLHHGGILRTAPLRRRHNPPPWDVPFSVSTAEKYERPCSTPEAMKWKYCDTSLPDSDRISFLLDSLTPEEKISLLGNKASAVPRLSLPPYNWWSEALHGVSSSCCPGIKFKSTSFPQVCTTGASFNTSLFEAIGDAIGAEAIEHYSRLDDVPGLTYWAPNVNLFRDPRWGRGQEVPGEDPYLNGQYAAHLIPALQYGKDGRGRGDGRPRIAAACKHFAAYSIETGRMAFDAKVDEMDLEESYMPMFRKCVESGVLGFMCSYNAVNGVPSCANGDLLTSKLRREWGFDGYITGDCGAVGNIYASHHYTDSMEEGIAVALKSGVDSDCGGDIQAHGLTALDAGHLSIKDIDRALKSLFDVQFRLGYYNLPTSAPELELQRRSLDDSVHMHNDLALEAARQGIVLLKNGNSNAAKDPLPLSKEKHASIALFGPNADATYTMLGNYFGEAPLLVSPKQGLTNMGINISYMKGCNITAQSLESKKDDICRVAAASAATILVVGNNGGVENEGRDRISVVFPGEGQVELIQLASTCAKEENDKPVILIVMSGGPIDLSPYKKNKNIDAMLYVGYPGQSGGTAIAEAIYGDFSPSGRLATTIYPRQFAENVDIGDMRMRPAGDFPGRTYRYYTGEVVYPFGFGMSYSTFKRTMSMANDDGSNAGTSDAFSRVDIEVLNQGPLDCAHSILLFHSGPNAGHDGNPIRSLIGFEKLFLRVGEKMTVPFSIDSHTLRKNGIHRFSLAPSAEREDENGSHEIVISVT
mmetsp:Transcript_35546/g.72049  ORF Transcript_35546/g.72049 Transcript_35546/m.72049 type:complete len:781 (-) Transcript_35546:4126-6468(-)